MTRHSLLAMLALAGPPLFAQQQPPAPPVFSSEAELVVVDVVVTDGKGLPVRGLTRADFVVKEDGVAQEIATFEAIDRPATLATGSAATATGTAGATPLASNVDAGPERATIVVVFDEQHLSSISTEEVRRRLDKVWRGLGAANVVLVSTAGGGNWLGRLPEDAEGLQGALARFKGGRPPEPAGKVTDYEAFLISARRDDRVLVEVYRRYIDQSLIPDPTNIDIGERQIYGHQSETQKQMPPAGRSLIMSEAEQRWSVARQRQAATLASLTRLLTGLGGTPGRKAVILVSEGFVHDPAVLEHRALVEAARAARASVHVIDPRQSRGLSHDAESDDVIDARDSISVSARRAREAEGSDALALATGGRILRTLNGLDQNLARIGGELRTYYLLGYAPPSARKDGQYHKLKVELKREGLKLEARPGYFALAPAAQRAAREAPSTALQAALASPFDATGLPVYLAAFVLGQGRQGGSVVRLVAEVDAASVAQPDNLDALFQLAKQDDSTALQATLSAPVTTAGGTRIRLERQFEAPEGAYQARVVVRERGGPKRIGSVLQSLAVQPSGAFRMTTPILTDVLLADKSPLARAERRFTKGSTLHCLVEVVGTSGKPVQAGVEVKSADGKTVFQIPDSPIASHPPSRHWAIPLADLETGAYELVISVKDEAKAQGLESRERFEVVAAVAAAGL
jgi:VWFA-related protein